LEILEARIWPLHRVLGQTYRGKVARTEGLKLPLGCGVGWIVLSRPAYVPIGSDMCGLGKTSRRIALVIRDDIIQNVIQFQGLRGWP